MPTNAGQRLAVVLAFDIHNCYLDGHTKSLRVLVFLCVNERQYQCQDETQVLKLFCVFLLLVPHTAPLKEGEPYAAIPRQAIMDAASAKNSTGLKSVFVELKLLYPQGDDFHALLFHLIWERYVRKHHHRQLAGLCVVLLVSTSHS